MVKTSAIMLALVMSVAVPAAALAQQKPEDKKGAPAPHAAPHAAPRAAPHPGPAPHPVMRAAPPPHPAARAVPHIAPHPVTRATPHAAPHPVVRAAPHRAPSAARVIRREERRTQRHTATTHVTAAPAIKATASPAATKRATRAAARHERTLRRQEDRSVRRLPPSQRAARRAEIRHAREQRAQQRNRVTPNAQTQPNAQQAAQPRLRRNGQPRVTTQAARQGRFAAAFAAPTTAAQTNARRHRWSPREAWRHHARAAFIGWYGPVFWPYAYDDVFDYTFWPAAYDDGYWAYAYDDFFDGVFWGEAGPPAEYAYGPPPPSASSAPVRYTAVQQLCKEPGSGITAWPIADIEKKVGLNDDQKKLLADLRRDAQKAAGVFKVSCPAENAFPLTPPGRLSAMTARVQATLEAVDAVKPALNAFYNSLSDEQKERFNEIGPAPKPSAETTAQAPSGDGQNCKQPKPGLATLPIESIEDAVKPTDAQEADLDKLQEATNKAVGILQAACPDETPLTPPGRLDAMETRLKAMIDAANTVKPALDSFYASLSNEQKARFNRIGRELASNND